MNCSRVVGFASIAVFVFGCQMDNPAFDDDELGEDATDRGSDSTGDGDGDGDGESGTTDASTTDTTTTTDTSDDATTDSTTDSDTSNGDTTETETGANCPPGQTECEGGCVEDLATDPMNCGECGNACNEDQLCQGSCVPLKYVFVSSQKRTGAMEGIGGADDLCNELAVVANLPGSYFAWNSIELSYPNLDFDMEGAYRRTDGHIVADSYEDLTNGSLAMPINLDENQGLAPVVAGPGCDGLTAAVWSNTTPSGDFAGIPNCSSWTSNLGFGRVGSFVAVDGNWSLVDNCQLSCSIPLPIYCVQQTL